jgi:hypothetical protein
MTKIVYNACYGGFSLSDEAIMRYAEIKGITLYVKEEKWGGNAYATVPWDEYDRIEEECKKEGNYHRANELYFSDRDIERTDPALVQVVEELGDAANGAHAKLRITDLSPGTLYRIDEYDGNESVVTQDGYDWSVA